MLWLRLIIILEKIASGLIAFWLPDKEDRVLRIWRRALNLQKKYANDIFRNRSPRRNDGVLERLRHDRF